MTPLGMIWTSPAKSLNFVMRRPISSTIPDACYRRVSPTAYWSSNRTKNPRHVRTRFCAPKPNATPTIPAPATRLACPLPTQTGHQTAYEVEGVADDAFVRPERAELALVSQERLVSVPRLKHPIHDFRKDAACNVGADGDEAYAYDHVGGL